MPLVRVKARTAGVTGYVNCQRGTWLGNIFPLSRYPLKESLELYKRYLYWRLDNDRIFWEYLLRLRKKARREKVLLGCTCKLNVACHVDILINVINRYF